MIGKPQQIKARCIGKKFLTKTIVEATFRVEIPDFSFTPGQYATIIIDKTIRRQYSFASAPKELPVITFVVDTTPMGPGSKLFFGLNGGDEVAMIAPLGDFVMEESPRKKVLVCTGTGIAPLRSILRSGIQNSKFKIQNWSLYWGLRHEDDVYWDEELKTLTGQHTGSQYFLCLSKPGENWGLETQPSSLDLHSGFRRARGHVTEHVLENEKTPEDCDFYLCGNKGMIEELKKALIDKHVPEYQIKTDMFF